MVVSLQSSSQVPPYCLTHSVPECSSMRYMYSVSKALWIQEHKHLSKKVSSGGGGGRSLFSCDPVAVTRVHSGFLTVTWGKSYGIMCPGLLPVKFRAFPSTEKP